MLRIEKTVFISYRRKDISWALAVYQYLSNQKYDVFFDFSSISSGDFEQVIISNIKARAHFVLILTPTALDRCSEPGDWLKREIETAVDEKRNIIPLFFDGFSVSSPSVTQNLVGKLSAIKRYNGLDIPSGYFMEAMQRLNSRYLNIPLDAVIHPVSPEVRMVIKEEQFAANQALLQKREYIKELVKPAEENLGGRKQEQNKKATESLQPTGRRDTGAGERKKSNLILYGVGVGIILISGIACIIISIYAMLPGLLGNKTITPTITPTLTAVLTPSLTSEIGNLFDPHGKPVSEWNGIPIMSQAKSGQEYDNNTYSFKFTGTTKEAQDFYNAEMLKLGWSLTVTVPGDANVILAFQKDSAVLTVTIVTTDADTVVVLTMA